MMLTKPSKATVARLVVLCLCGLGIGGFQASVAQEATTTKDTKQGIEDLQDKLVRILNRLEELDRRLSKIEQKLSEPGKASPPSTSAAQGIADFIKSLLRSRLVDAWR
jgi:hypothetical protein